MSYSKEFIEFVVGQMSEAGTITYRLMFGAYSLYLDGKLFGIVGNDKVFIKQTKSGKAVIPEVESEPPYEGAKIEQRGKNFYVDIGNAIVTINAGSMTIITAHKK